jgi:hypothetical protein
MSNNSAKRAIIFKIAAVIVFIGGIYIMTLMDQWGFLGRLPGAAVALGVAPYIWRRGNPRQPRIQSLANTSTQNEGGDAKN